MRGLKDVVPPRLRLLLVGCNPSLRSGATGHHYAGPGNQFWVLLHAAGLTSERLAPSDGLRLAEFGIGSTNLVSRPTRAAADLTRAELAAGTPRLRRMVQRHRPAIVAYTGKGVYLAAARLGSAGWGLQPARLFPPAADFVLPSPSGLVRMRFEEKLAWYRELRRLLENGEELVSGA